MISTVLKKLFGSRNDRLLKRYGHAVRAINAIEPALQKLNDEALRARTDAFKARVAAGESLENI
ncbi:MAG: hypothetical protein ACK5ZP_04710, partial [Betaproteobacteria bacterium]